MLQPLLLFDDEAARRCGSRLVAYRRMFGFKRGLPLVDGGQMRLKAVCGDAQSGWLLTHRQRFVALRQPFVFDRELGGEKFELLVAFDALATYLALHDIDLQGAQPYKHRDAHKLCRAARRWPPSAA